MHLRVSHIESPHSIFVDLLLYEYNIKFFVYIDRSLQAERT